VPAEPFTIAHFEEWAAELVLDNGRNWLLEEWQAAFVADVFLGIPECWLIVPEGNGKTTLVAGLALYHAEFTPEAWVPVAASSRDQARILYRQAKGFIARTASLEGKFRSFDGYRRIDYREAGSQIEVFAADERTGDGVIPSLCILDELHRHRTLGLYETWRGKLDKRDAQIVTISTAGEPGSEFEEARERIRQGAAEVERAETFVRAVSPQVVLHEWAVPEGGDVDDLELVARANPFSGVTVEKLGRKRDSATMTVGHWRRFTCNLPTRSENAAITEAEWFGAVSPEEIPAGEPVWAGLDLGWKWDTTALVPLWWKVENHRLFGKPHVIVPPRDGTSLDPSFVLRALAEVHARNPIHTVVMDMSRGPEVSAWVETELGAVVIDRTQTPVMAVEDYDRFMEALRNGWLFHPGDSTFNRHVLNAVARVLPGGDAVFSRASTTRQGGNQDKRVIDALIAAAMANSTAAVTARPAEEPMISWA
jgi:phage terminase large subunit-like protein